MFQHSLKCLTWFSTCLEIFNIVFNTIVIICWVLILHTLNQIDNRLCKFLYRNWYHLFIYLFFIILSIKKHVEISVCSENCKKHVENFRIQVLKWSVPDAHPDSRVLSILKFSGIFENCMRGIFYSLKDTLLFKCSEFLIL